MKQLFVLLMFTLLTAPSIAPSFACETTHILPKANLNASAEFSSVPNSPESWSEISSLAELEMSIDAYDSLANRHTVRLFFFRTDSTRPDSWRVVVYISGDDVGQVSTGPYELARGTLGFDSDGDIQSPETSFLDMYIVWVNAGAPQHLTVTFESLTQYESPSVVSSITQDGGPGACTQRGSLDFDGDGSDDIAIWRPSLGIWAIRKSSTEGSEVLWKQWGLPGDYPMPGDYTGDKKADVVVWRPSNGNWYVCPSEADFDCSYASTSQFGLPGDRPLKGDFDGDTVLDRAVWRSDGGLFIYQSSRTEEVVIQQWGLPGDIPLGSGVNQ